jgi:hypothetical protein
MTVYSRRACTYAEASFSSQNSDRDLGVHYQRAAFYCPFFEGKTDSVQRISINTFFLFMVGRVCRVKRFTAGWQTFRASGRSWNGGAEVTETTVNRLLCCGFPRTGKAMGQLYQCWWRIYRDINVFFQVRISHVLRFISICDLLTDCSSYFRIASTAYMRKQKVKVASVLKYHGMKPRVFLTSAQYLGEYFGGLHPACVFYMVYCTRMRFVIIRWDKTNPTIFHIDFYLVEHNAM